MENKFDNKSWIKKLNIKLFPPSLKDNTGDIDRLIKEINKAGPEIVNISFQHLQTLSGKLRKAEYQVEAVLYEDKNCWHLIDIFPCNGPEKIHVIAMDLGSSTVVLRLINLENHETIGETTFYNPQIKIGSDILARIHHAAREGGLEELRSILINKINEETIKLAQEYKIEIKMIIGMAVAGNTTMTHLFLGLDPYWLCREPYIPVVNSPGIIKAQELCLNINPEAPVLVFPNVGSYFGGDLIAGILASDMINQEQISFLVDVGTNAEVVIGNRDWLMGCAGAAGPALEGGVADMGMMAGPGVIDKVAIDPLTSEIKIRTIGLHPPVGICGSGLIDLVAQLFLAGMLDLRGKYRSKCGSLLKEIDGIKHLEIVSSHDSGTNKGLTISQIDIDGLIRSKAAMYTILTTIANTVTIPLNEIKRFFVAGTFGSYIDPKSAITIGMIPDLPLENYISLGNTSLKGAAMAILSGQAKKEIHEIRDRITYLELNVNQEFMNLFSAAKFIPHTDSSLFPSVKMQACERK